MRVVIHCKYCDEKKLEEICHRNEHSYLYGVNQCDASSPRFELSKTAFIVENLCVEDGELYGDVDILGTKYGDILEDVMSNSDVKFCISGCGTVGEDGFAEDYAVSHVVAVRLE